MKDTPLTLYVVDDDEALRRSLLMLLFSQGLAVQAFDSGEAFLDAVDMRQPGCVILDLRMGGISGLEVLERLRLGHSPLVTLFLTVKDEETARRIKDAALRAPGPAAPEVALMDAGYQLATARFFFDLASYQSKQSE